MLSKKKTDQLVDYWITSSKEKLKTMEGLFRIKRYADSLFFWTFVIRKSAKSTGGPKDQKASTENSQLTSLGGASGTQIRRKR